MTPARTRSGKRLGRIRHRVYEVLEQARPGDALARRIHFVLVVTILASVAAVVLESVPDYARQAGTFFIAVEIGSVAIFTIEYVLRLWAAIEYPPFRHISPVKARLRYAATGGSIIDLLTILPFYLAMLVPADLRVLVVFRLLRVLKLARYSTGIRSLYEAVYAERRALLGCLVILMAVMLTAASLMSLAEGHVQPEKFGTIPAAMYWAIITLTTTGYGDAVPITPLGKIIAGAAAIMGIAMLALPVGIIATAFAEVIHRRDFVVTWGMVARVPLFADLNADDVATIMRMLQSQSAQPGEIIVRRGEMGHSMYFIAAGQVEVERPHRQKFILNEGQFFGEIAVLRNTRRSATIRALVRTDLLVLDALDLRRLMADRPDIGAHVEQVARSRLQEQEELSAKGGPALRDLGPDDTEPLE
jgi:voltage-gated potassium channel